MKILFCGDYIVQGNPKVNDKSIFGNFLKIIEGSDIAIYNQEHPVSFSDEVYTTKKHGTTDGCFSSALKPIIEAGFNYVSLGNNHIFNKGVSGLNDTIDFFKQHNIKTFGAGRNILEAKRILYVTHKDIKTAFLNFSENEYNTATRYHGGANPLNIIDNVNQIKEAKSNADFVFVIIHGGLEYCPYPTPRMVKHLRYYVDNGASAIICHHAHIVSGYEVYKDCPIFYGIGNFIPAKFVKQFRLDHEASKSFPIQFEVNNNKLSFQGYPLFFSYDKYCLEYLKGNELENFNKRQKEINELLLNENKLKEKIYNEYLSIERRSYYFTLFTRSNYFLFKVFRKLRLLSIYHRYIFWKMRLNKKNSALWNLFRCETHNDVLDLIYEKHIDTYKND